MGTKNGSVIGNLFWKFAERVSAQLVTLIVSIILARILSPADYGVISIVMIFITMANVFVSDGLGSALIQKKDADELDFSTVLYFNMGLSIVLYLLIYFAAPYLSAFYGTGYEILTPVLRVLGIRIIFASINSVQQAYVSRKMIFRNFFISTLAGTVCSAVVGIVMALNGFGVWSLVFQYLSNTIVNTFTLAVLIDLKISIKFSIGRLKHLFSYGIKILGASLLITGFQEMRALIIGKFYSSSDLAFYDKGKQFPSLVVTNINTSIGAVLFPKMSSEQESLEKIKETTRKSIKFGSFLMCPMMLGLAVVADNFIYVVLTEKWLECVPLLRWFCIVYLFQPIHTANMQAIKAIGRSDIYLKLEIVKKSIELVTLLLVMNLGVEAIVISMAMQTTFFTFINAYPNRKLLDYSVKEQLADIIPSIGMSCIMGFLVCLIGFLPMTELSLLIIQVTAGIIVYILLAIITKNKELHYIVARINKKPKYEKVS